MSKIKWIICDIHDSHYCASNGKPVAADPYWRSTEFFVNVATIRIGPTGLPQVIYVVFYMLITYVIYVPSFLHVIYVFKMATALTYLENKIT